MGLETHVTVAGMGAALNVYEGSHSRNSKPYSISGCDTHCERLYSILSIDIHNRMFFYRYLTKTLKY